MSQPLGTRLGSDADETAPSSGGKQAALSAAPSAAAANEPGMELQVGIAKLPAVVRSWLDRLMSHDLEGLLALYTTDAEVDAFAERPRGHEEIRDFMTLHWSRLRGLRLDGITPQEAAIDTCRLETEMRTGLFRARLQHEFLLEAGRIRRHGLTLVDLHRPPGAAS